MTSDEQALRDSAQLMGEAMGDGIADIVLGLRTAGEVVDDMLGMLVRVGLRKPDIEGGAK